MGLTLLETIFSIFGNLLGVRGHIPDQAVRISSPVAVPAGAVMGVLAAAALSIGFFAAAMAAAVWLALRLI